MKTLRELTDMLIVRDELLKENEKKYAAIFNLNPIPMIITTAVDGIVVDVNSSFIKYSGYEKNEVVNKSMSELNMYKDYGDRVLLLTEILINGYVNNKEVKIIKKDGTELIAYLSINCIKIKDEKCLLVVLVDVFDSTKIREDILKKI